MPRTAPEAEVVEACVAFLRWRAPGTRSYRHDGGDPVGPGVAGKRKKSGTTNGAADLLALLFNSQRPEAGPLQVEFKRWKGTVSDDQLAYHAAERAEGRKVFIVRSVAQMEAAIDEHMGPSKAEPATQRQPKRRRRSARAGLPSDGTRHSPCPPRPRASPPPSLL